MNISLLRFQNQQLLAPNFTTPLQLVQWFGAVQAQEYLPSQWALGQRLPSKTGDIDIKQALMDRQIVRTWPMRGTIHYVPAEDAAWMTALTARRINKKYKTMRIKMELTQDIIEAAKPILTTILKDGAHLIRAEIYQALADGGIPNAKKFGPFILTYWAQEGLLCFGTYRDKQPTFTLLDTWVLYSRNLTQNEALLELTKRYFQSHGPATLHDFAWWSGLTIKEARQGIELASTFLMPHDYNAKQYFTAASLDITPKEAPLPTRLLPCFDEYTVAYKDRSIAVDAEHLIEYGYGVSWNNVIINGRIAGAWSRTIKKDEVEIHIKPVRPFSKKECDELEYEAHRYAQFIQSPKVSLVGI